MLKTKSTKYHYEVHSSDVNGFWSFKVHKDGDQLAIENGMYDEVYIGVDKKELTAIRDLLTRIIDGKK